MSDRPLDGLDAAWAEVEAAADSVVPGIGAVAVSRWSWNTPEPFRATWRTEEASGPTPTAALQALAAKLREPKPRGHEPWCRKTVGWDDAGSGPDCNCGYGSAE